MLVFMSTCQLSILKVKAKKNNRLRLSYPVDYNKPMKVIFKCLYSPLKQAGMEISCRKI